MDAGFGDYLVVLLKNHGFTQQGFIDWVLANQNPPTKFKTTFSLKEHLRVSRLANTPAYTYPLLFDSVHFFESKGKRVAASRIRHIYHQQSYDTGRFNGLFAEATPHSEGVEWIVFPDVDRSTTLLRKREWLNSLSGGDRKTLRESISTFYLYAKSYVHSPVRQLLAVDLARMCIANAEYADGYSVAHIYATKWEEYMALEQRTYEPLLADLHDYLVALQLKAIAVSHIYYYAPLRASSRLFRIAHDELMRSKRYFGRNEAVYRGLHVDWHVRYLRTLCRSVMNLSQTGADGEQVELTRQAIRHRVARLAMRTVDNAGWHGDEFVDYFVVRDTIARSGAITSETMAEIDAVERTICDLEAAVAHEPRHQQPMPKYRLAMTRAVWSINKYRVLASGEAEDDHIRHALEEAASSIKHIATIVSPARQHHIRLSIRTLITYLQAVRIAHLQKEGLRLQHSEFDDFDGLSIFRANRYEGEISTEIQALDREAAKYMGIMFEVNPSDSEHIECLLQANAFKRRANVLDVSRVQSTKRVP